MATIYLADIKAWNGAAEVTLYFSTGTGWISQSGDTPAHTWYEPRISQPAFMRRDAFTSRRTFGRSAVSFGELVLSNPDGALDYMADYAFDGRAILLKVGTLTKPGAPTWTTVLAGKIEQATFNWSQLVLRIRDRQIDLDRPFQTTKYLGTNNEMGVEGWPDIQGRPKVKCRGLVYNVPPPCVNQSKLIYQVNDGAASTLAVYDNGVSLVQGADYTNLSQLQGTPPSVGEWRSCPTLGMFRLGSTPAGQITADVDQGATDADNTAAQIMQNIAITEGGIDPGDVSSADVTALDVANNSVIGIWSDSETTCSAMLDLCANAVGAYWGFDNLGVLRMAQLRAPSGTPDLTITATEILSIERAPSRDENRGLPVWRVKLGYKRIWQLQTEVAGVISSARRTELGAPYRIVVSDDATVQTAHPFAKEMLIDTVLTNPVDAEAEAERRLWLYHSENAIFDVTIAIDGSIGADLNIDDVVSIDIDRYDMTGGRLFRVIGLLPDLRRNRVDLTLWSPGAFLGDTMPATDWWARVHTEALLPFRVYSAETLPTSFTGVYGAANYTPEG